MTTPNDEFLLRRSVQLMEEDAGSAKAAFSAAARASAPVCPSCNKPVRHRQGLEWCQDNQMSEATLQDRIMGRAKRRGYTVGHVGKGIAAYTKAGEPIFVTPFIKGWPDLWFMKPGAPVPVFFMECKRQSEHPDEDQLRIMTMLIECGIPGAVIRPSDLRTGVVNAILGGK